MQRHFCGWLSGLVNSNKSRDFADTLYMERAGGSGQLTDRRFGEESSEELVLVAFKRFSL